MPSKIIQLMDIWIAGALILAALGGTAANASDLKIFHSSPAYSADQSRKSQEPDIQWFRDQLKISDRYVQEQEGIWGVSWAHFLTMVFLGMFVLGSLAVWIQQQRRTRDILDSIRKEMENDDSDN
jgi:hypothetical protein